MVLAQLSHLLAIALPSSCSETEIWKANTDPAQNPSQLGILELFLAKEMWA